MRTAFLQNFPLYNALSVTVSAWKFGNFFCKVVPYLQGVSVDASINILIAISIERCLAICYPMKSHKRNRIPKYVIIIIWIFPFFLPMPWLFFFNVQRHDNESDIEVRYVKEMQMHLLFFCSKLRTFVNYNL